MNGLLKRLICTTVVLAAVICLSAPVNAGGLNADWLQMTPRASNPIPAARGGLYTSSVTGRPTLVDSSGQSFTIGVGSSWVASAGPPSGAVIGDCWRDTTDSNKVYCKESSGIIAQRSDAGSPGSFGSGAANLVLASPTSGGAGPITLRALVAADLTGVLGGIYQPLDSDLTAIANLSSTGYLARTGTNTWALRSFVAGSGISLTNADGIAAGTTIALTDTSLTVTAGAGLSASGCSPVSLGGACTLFIANTAVSAASYPSAGQIPTFTVNSQGQLTAAGSTTTLTGPSISAPVFSGSATGTYTLAGTPTITAPTISGPTLSGTVLGTYTLGGTPTFPATAVVASSYPAAGSIPTFTVGSDGRLTAAGSTTTLTSPAISGPVLSGSATGTYTLAGTPTITAPAISSPVLSGSATGTYTLAGTPTMGANLAFGSSFKGTGLAAGSAAGDTVRWEQAGVAGPTFYLNTGQSFAANGYVGIAGDGSSTLVVNVVPWVVPVSCTLRNIRVFGFANTSGSVVFTIYKATAALSPSYAATAVTCTLTNTFSCTDTTHSVSLAAGELVVGFTGSSWAANGASITSQCIPN